MGYYDAIVESYNKLYGFEQEKKYAQVLDSIKEGSIALDIGCGTGLFMEKIKDKFKLVVGVDSSLGMLKKASKYENVVYVNCDATKLPFVDKVFDTVFSFSVMQDVKDKEKFLSEASRVCRSKAFISILKVNKDLQELKTLFSKYFVVEKVIEEEKDFIFVLNPK